MIFKILNAFRIVQKEEYCLCILLQNYPGMGVSFF